MKGAQTKGLDDLRKEGLSSLLPRRLKIMVGAASCGLAAGAGPVFEALEAGVKKKKIRALVRKTGCIGMCHQEPLVDVAIPGKGRFIYAGMTPQKVSKLLDDLKQGSVPGSPLGRIDREDFLLDGSSRPCGPETADRAAAPRHGDLPFYRKQARVALRNCGFINPEDIREYIAKGGYATLQQLLQHKTPLQVIRDVEHAGLRGRGGAGFPTGLKWKACRSARAERKFVICNADEGDPGAYMDRSILEGDPHAVIEGMLIAAYAVGASQGFIYVRDEYPLAIQRLDTALGQAEKHGLLGDKIAGSPFCFRIALTRGAGAFVCGEETSLIKSIEGDCGEPRQRPPFPAESGLWGMPTVINNVETLATVPALLARGPQWFTSMGTDRSKGTKVFSLVGKVNRIGLVEVPMGTTLRDIIFDIGGGIPGGRQLKAVQTGGPSGGCIPAHLLDLPVDYEALSSAGSIMGSGGLIVMDDKTCMVDVARYFLAFLENESCGKCTPCRIGIRRMREIVDDICAGRGSVDDLAILENMARSIRKSALCGLGRTAPNPVLSTLKHFKDEYLAHILLKKCPAGVCKELITFAINPKVCTGCGACRKACPAEAVRGEKNKAHKINTKTCIKCGACIEVCPVSAVTT